MLAPDNMLLELIPPFSMFICGPSKAGKSSLTKEILQRKPFSHPIDKFIYVANQDQPEFHSFAIEHPEVKFVSSWDDSYLSPRSLIIFDDFGQDFSKELNKFITGFITKTVHHSNVSVIVILHNLYTPGLRTASLSVDYLVVFNFPRDNSTISSLAKQIFPGTGSFLRDSYNFATNKPHGYLFIDTSAVQNKRYRCRTSVFNDEDMYVLSPLQWTG